MVICSANGQRQTDRLTAMINYEIYRFAERASQYIYRFADRASQYIYLSN